MIILVIVILNIYLFHIVFPYHIKLKEAKTKDQAILDSLSSDFNKYMAIPLFFVVNIPIGLISRIYYCKKLEFKN